MKKIFLYSFFVIGFVELLSILLDVELPERICKPFVMITLFGYYLTAVSSENRSQVLLLALILSWAGDVLLMLQRDGNFFIFGLLAFLLSHVFYILTYRQHADKKEMNGLQGIQRARFSFPFILAGTGLIVVLYPSLGDLKYPVMIYALILILMVLNALFRYGHTNTKSFWMVFLGAVLFMVSDSLLAINKFLLPVSQGVFWIMLTYMSAQLFIVKGLVEHSKRS